VGGGDELVRVRLDAHRDPDHHRHDDPVLTRDRVEPGDLEERVDDDPPDPRLHGGDQLGGRLVVAVHRDALGREAGPQRDGELAPARDVEAQALVGDPAGHLRAQERLRRVMDGLRPERGRELGGPGAEVGLVDHEERGAVPLGQVAHVDAGDLHGPVVAPGRVARPHRRRELIEPGGIEWTRPGGLGRKRDAGVQRAGGMRPHHIRSGAETPSSPRPLANTWRAATHSASRARCRSVVSSSPIGSTRHES
jgi:hypothetical protein